ncbi:transcription factor bHLH128-like isoform X2 [Iris pallida]|uniref:Transcription factor bHLH128-like isoform X2 n=1 Tax=Iris pallida TaxID=29817 RepID=A0AAX6ECW2_IRIPA|nr:transcription factor bHLH128-like isoform X2 [Iris pallida]
MKRTPIYRPSTTTGPPPAGLTRYGSAPGSLLTSITDSILNGDDSDFGSGSETAPRHLPAPTSRFFSAASAAGDSSPCLTTSESSCCKDTCECDDAGAADPKHLLARQSSSPAGFFSHLLLDNSLSVNRGNGHYSQPLSTGVHTMPRTTRLKSQLSFSRQEPLAQISEIGINDMGESVIGGNRSDETCGNVGQSYISTNYQISSWDDTNSIAFSAPSSKRARDCNEDLLNSFSNIDSQFDLTASLDMDQQDSVAFKVRAKRGCATHPRSIAERERRTRISDKLRKLQELVPNMDKQTSTADMLDLAVEQIKKLQSQVQNLRQEQADCTCACKEENL